MLVPCTIKMEPWAMPEFGRPCGTLLAALNTLVMLGLPGGDSHGEHQERNYFKKSHFESRYSEQVELHYRRRTRRVAALQPGSTVILTPQKLLGIQRSGGRFFVLEEGVDIAAGFQHAAGAHARFRPGLPAV